VDAISGRLLTPPTQRYGQHLCIDLLYGPWSCVESAASGAPSPSNPSPKPRHFRPDHWRRECSGPFFWPRPWVGRRIPSQRPSAAHVDHGQCGAGRAFNRRCHFQHSSDGSETSSHNHNPWNQFGDSNSASAGRFSPWLLTARTLSRAKRLPVSATGSALRVLPKASRAR